MNHLNKKIRLSYRGGEQRKVAIAGILAMKPEILILDEPTVGLDPLSKKEIFDKIKFYQKERKATVVIVSHDLNVVAEYVNKILILNDGKIVKYDTVDNVFLKKEELENIGLKIPEITEIFYKLREKGIPVNTNIYTAEEGRKEILSLLERKG